MIIDDEKLVVNEYDIVSEEVEPIKKKATTKKKTIKPIEEPKKEKIQKPKSNEDNAQEILFHMKRCLKDDVCNYIIPNSHLNSLTITKTLTEELRVIGYCVDVQSTQDGYLLKIRKA